MEFILSAFADEADEQLDGQLKALKAANIRYLEIRGVDGRNIGELTAAEAKDVRRRLDEAGIGVSAIGSPYGKIKVSEPFEPHLEAMKRTLEVANLLGTRYMRVFSFFLDDRTHEQSRDIVLERMERMLTTAEAAGIFCCHENEKGIYGDRAVYCRELYDVFGDRLGCVYDPSNFVQCGEDAYAAFELLRPFITYYHMKDGLRENGLVLPVGEGDGDIPRLLRTLAAEQATTFMTLEPHLMGFTGLSALEVDGGASMRHRYAFLDNRESFTFASDALQTLLQDLGYQAQNGRYRSEL